MAADSTNKFIKAAESWTGVLGLDGIPNEIATTFELENTSGLPQDTAVTLVIDRVDSLGNTTPALRETITGVVSGLNIVDCIRGVEGTAQPHNGTAVVEVMLTASMWNNMIDGFLVNHTQDGKHLAPSADLDAATKKYVDDNTGGGISLSDVYPIGCIYTEITGVNPNTTFGFGTWSQFGEGQVLVGQKSTDTDFDTSEETGGAKTVNSSHIHTMGTHYHETDFGWDGSNFYARSTSGYTPSLGSTTSTTYRKTFSNSSNTTGGERHGYTSAVDPGNTGSGGSSTLSIVQSYIVVYFWKRTA